MKQPLPREDEDFLRKIVNNPEFERIFNIVMEAKQAEQLEYTRQCLRGNPPLMEEAIRSEAAATAFQDMLYVLRASLNLKSTHQGERQ